MKYKNYKYWENSNNCCSCGKTDCYENGYESYLRKKYKLSDDCKLLIKQGYISKNNSNSESREVLTQTESDIDKSIDREIQNTIEKIQKFISDAISNIEVLEIQNSSYKMDEHLIHEEIESEIESLFTKLSKSMQEFTKKSYQKIYILSAQAIDEDMESTGGLSAMPNPEKELLNRVDSWMMNLKKQIFKNIDAIMDDLHIERKSYFQKGFFSDIFEGVINCFNSIGEKISTMAYNVVNWTKTVAKKTIMWIQGVEKYEIVFSGGDNACEICREMAGKVFPRNELNISQTAPPFHPNCGCKIIPFVEKESETEIEQDEHLESITLPKNIIPKWLYNVALPKVIDAVLIEKITKNNPLYEPIKTILLISGTTVLDFMKCPISKVMYVWGMIGNGKEMPSHIKDMLINKYKTSPTVKNEINNCLEKSKNGTINVPQTDIYFNQERDLYYSMGSSNLSISGFQKPDGKWDLKVKIGDLYDFEFWELNELKHSDFTVYVNDLGYAMQKAGMMVQYDTTVEFRLENYDFGG